MNCVLVRESMGIAQTRADLPGAITIFATRWDEGNTTVVRAINANGPEGPEYYATVVEYQQKKGEPLYLARFPVLPPGQYEVLIPGRTVSPNSSGKKVTVFPQNVSDVSFRPVFNKCTTNGHGRCQHEVIPVGTVVKQANSKTYMSKKRKKQQ